MKYMAIIDADEKPVSCEFIGCNGNVAPYLIGATTNIKPLEQKPKTGKWIEDAETYYKMLNERGLGVDEYTPYFTDDIACSVCLAKYSCIDNETQFFKFCPNCGADMRGESE